MALCWNFSNVFAGLRLVFNLVALIQYDVVLKMTIKSLSQIVVVSFKLTVNLLNLFVIDVVVQCYPWFNFYFLLFHIHYHILT